MKNKVQNKIIVGHDQKEAKINEEEICFSIHDNHFHIHMLKDAALVLEIENTKDYILSLEVEEGVSAIVSFLKKGTNGIAKENYTLKKNSHLQLQKMCFTHENREKVSAVLEGKGANINYICKTLATTKEIYEMDVLHKAPNTVCTLYNHGITYEKGSISFGVTNKVPKGIKNAEISQNSQIVTLNQEKSEIKPNLFIEENEVEAAHAAHIGPIDSTPLFYLQSRGISKETAYKLLLKGFLLQKLAWEDERFLKIMDTYWR